MTEVIKLGQLLTGNEQRDAIHIAVAPVVANEKLYPGQEIGFVDNRQTKVGPSKSPIGIVDPFLKGPVFQDEKFWLWLTPYTIQSLRHEWTHPAFTAQAPLDTLEKYDAKLSASVKWIENFADNNDVEYDQLIDGAARFIRTGDYLIDGGRWEGNYIPDEFWDHYEIVTGTKVNPANKDNFFSCSC